MCNVWHRCFRDALLILKKRRVRNLKEPEIIINIRNIHDQLGSYIWVLWYIELIIGGKNEDNVGSNLNETEKNEESKENKRNDL